MCKATANQDLEHVGSSVVFESLPSPDEQLDRLAQTGKCIRRVSASDESVRPASERVNVRAVCMRYACLQSLLCRNLNSVCLSGKIFSYPERYEIDNISDVQKQT